MSFTTFGTLTYVAGPEPTEENKTPEGMVFTYRTKGGFYEQVDPITKQSKGTPQFFRLGVKTPDDSSQPLEPVWKQADGTYKARNE